MGDDNTAIFVSSLASMVVPPPIGSVVVVVVVVVANVVVFLCSPHPSPFSLVLVPASPETAAAEAVVFAEIFLLVALLLSAFFIFMA